MAIVPATALAGAMVVGMNNGALASSFSVSGQQFQIAASEMQLDGFAQYGGVVAETNKTPHAVAVAAVKKATIKNLCQSVVTPMPFGTFTLQIKAGGGTPVTAENLFVDMTQMEGDAVFTNIEIGRDASTLDKGAGIGFTGMFGQQATSATLTNVKQVAWSTNAGTFRLNGMSMKLVGGSQPCF